MNQIKPGKTGYAPLAFITLAHLMAVLDNTVMMVALPSVQSALGVSAADRQWIVTAYTAAFAGLLLLGGKLADRFGANRTLAAGVIGFAAASAVGGAAFSPIMLIAARALQGGFGAVLTSSTKTLLALTYTESGPRAKAMGIFSATLAFGGVFGMILGGLLTASLGWRWCLYINLPVSLAVIAGGLRFIPRAAVKKRAGVDFVSAAVFFCAMFALVFGFGRAASDGWASRAVIISLLVSAGLSAAFVIMQKKRPEPLFPLRIVTDRNRAGAFISMVFNSFGTLGLMLILTFQLQKVRGFSPPAAGLALMPMMLAAVALSAGVVPRLINKAPDGWLISGGVFLSGLGLLPLAFLGAAGWFWPLVILSQILEGAGSALGAAPAMYASLRGVLPADTGVASSASSAASQIGSSIGAALLNTVAVSAAAGAGGAAAARGFAAACGFGFALLMIVSVVVLIIMTARFPRFPR